MYFATTQALKCWCELCAGWGLPSARPAASEVKLENTDKANWRHSKDISQQCSYLVQARFSPKAGLYRETGHKWKQNSK